MYAASMILVCFGSHSVIFFGIWAPCFQGFKGSTKLIIMESRLLWLNHSVYLSVSMILVCFGSHSVLFFGIWVPVFEGFQGSTKLIIIEIRLYCCNHLIDLSPGGTLRSRARKGSNCFYFTFYWCRKRYWGFQNPHW